MNPGRAQADSLSYHADADAGFGVGPADSFVAVLGRLSRLSGGSAERGEIVSHYQARNVCGSWETRQRHMALIASMFCARAISFARSMLSASTLTTSKPSEKSTRISYVALFSISLPFVVVNSMYRKIDDMGHPVKGTRQDLHSGLKAI